MSLVIRLLRKPYTAIAMSVVMGFAVSAVILMIAGYNPGEVYSALFQGIFGRPRHMVQSVIRSTPIILTGLSVAFAFKTGLFNIGAEGQFIIGSIAAALAGYHLQLPPVLHFLVVAMVAMAASGIWGGFIGFLKARFGIHEVITSIMLNWIALYLNNFLIRLPWVRRPGAEASHQVLDSARIVILNSYKNSEAGRAALQEHPVLADIILRTDVNYGIVIAILIAIFVAFVLKRTTTGFELRAVGQNKDAAEFAGISVNANIIKAMVISGMIAGLAGALLITGTNPHRISILATHEGYGFDGIAVALMAASNPIGCILSGLFFGSIQYGGATIQSQVGAPSEIISIMIGTIVFFIAMASIFPMLSEYLKRRFGANNAKNGGAEK